MDRNRWTASLVGVLALSAFAGCTSTRGDRALLIEENQGLRAEIVERNTSLESLQMEISDRDARIAELQREVEDARWQAQQAAVAEPPAQPSFEQMHGDAAGRAAADAFSEIAGVTGSATAGEITASVEGDVLFAAGKSALRDSARQALDSVARVLTASHAGRTIRVAGHTDTDPIRKSGHKSNYHLAFERAYAVREYLIKKGVPAGKIYIASHGPDQARGSKQESRRVEIAVVLND